MGNFEQIINKRTTPGVLIIDCSDTLVHSNSEALSMIPALGHSSPTESRELCLPPEITSLCQRLKSSAPPAKAVHGNLPSQRKSDTAGSPLGLRAFFISNPGVTGAESHSIMVLIENVVEKHEVDLEKAKKEYGLSRREGEVLRHICRGLPNREIAKAMFICEYTVKDHIKKIMKRMKVRSRSEVVALLR
jgi:DNA-binding NarL/FixJ family response regulator